MAGTLILVAASLAGGAYSGYQSGYAGSQQSSTEVQQLTASANPTKYIALEVKYEEDGYELHHLPGLPVRYRVGARQVGPRD